MEVVKEVLLFETEIWVMTPQLDKSLKGFHHRAVRRMAGMGPKRQWDRTCVVMFCKFRTNLPPVAPSGSVVLGYWLVQIK